MNKILTTVEDETGKEYIQNHHFLSIHMNFRSYGWYFMKTFLTYRKGEDYK